LLTTVSIYALSGLIENLYVKESPVLFSI